MIRVRIPVWALRVQLERLHDGLISHVYGFESRTRYFFLPEGETLRLNAPKCIDLKIKKRRTIKMMYAMVCKQLRKEDDRFRSTREPYFVMPASAKQIIPAAEGIRIK